MKERIKLHPLFIYFTLAFIFGLCFFYLKYVPLIKPFQMALAPFLFITLITTSINIKQGILTFVFFFPLINNLPYFFGIDGSVPHAPTALVLFLFFFLGWMIHRSFFFSNVRFNHPVFKPLVLLSLIIIVSGIITFLRYGNFFPFLSGHINELVVNVNGVRAGGALMSVIFTSLSYLSGFLFFLILFNTIKSKAFLHKMLIVFSCSIFISLVFSLVQRYYSLDLGNTTFWVRLGQINSTFKDPNSFGIYLCASFPLILGMAVSFHKNLKPFFISLLIFILFAFPSTGSRSGILGIGVSIITFIVLFFITERRSYKKKIIYGTSLLLIFIFLFLSFLFVAKQSILYKRMQRSLDLFVNKESLNLLFSRKIDLWTLAFHMIKDYPLTGVGVGSYIVEFPNYAEEMKLSFGGYTDSAENYIFQVGSELGLIGLILICWIFFEVIRLIWRGRSKLLEDTKNKFILIGVISSLSAIFVNFLFHSYIGSFEVKFFFWLLIAMVIFLFDESKRSKIDGIFSQKFKLLALILTLFFGTVHLWNSTQSLSIQNRTERFGWDQDFGLYQLEEDYRGFSYRWTKKRAGIAEENLGSRMVIPLKASHPDINKVPVKVRVYSANQYFKKREMIEEIILKDPEWFYFKYAISEMFRDKIYLVFETDRTWQPLGSLGIPDPRHLAIGIGRVWFEYPTKFDEGKIKEVQKIPVESWEGEFKEKLWGNGISKMKFAVEEDNAAILLNLQTSTAYNLGPYIIIRIDGRIVGKCMINSDGLSSLAFTPGITQGEHVLSVEFINDIHVQKLNQDRNLILGDLEIVYLK